MTRFRLVIDPIACDGYGICHELVPEHVALDDWGYPLLLEGAIEGDTVRHAKRAVAACPRLALRMRQVAEA